MYASVRRGGEPAVRGCRARRHAVAERVSPPLDLWLRAFLATQAVEVPIAAGWLRDRRPIGECALVAALATTLTHPALWYIWPWTAERAGLALGEAVVWTAEAAVYAAWLRWRGEDPRSALRVGVGISVLANGASTAVGLLLWG
jgi:hypothetical protein